MFSSRSKDIPETTVPAAAQPAAKRGRPAPSIISADMELSGAIASSGDIQIDGRVEGDVRSVGLVIGDKAEIHGEIYAEDVTVRGKVVGRIRARKITLTATAHVEGDILHEAFSVEAGAFFEGSCRHSDNPLGDIDLSRRAAPMPPSAPVSVQSAPAPANAQAPLFGSLSPAAS
jgi:cytoskeletal protein CcmA (bactofilin family)